MVCGSNQHKTSMYIWKDGNLSIYRCPSIERLIQIELDCLYFVSGKIFLLSQEHFPDKCESEQETLIQVTVF